MSEKITRLSHTFLDILNQDSFVLDLGASNGDFIDEIVDRYNCKVYGVEPDMDFFEQARIKYKDNDNVTIFCNAIAAAANLTKFYPRTGRGVSGSFFANHPSVQKEPIFVRSQSIRGFFRWNDIKKVDLLKMDIEGAEIDIIKGCRRYEESFALCNQIVIEFHNYLNIGITEDDVLECIERLDEFGFEFINCSTEKQPKYFDCLFVNRSL